VAAELAVVAVSLGSAFTFALSTSLKHASASAVAGRQNTRNGAWGRFVRSTLTHPLWLGGIAADVLGFSLQVIALHLGALAVVQPLLISGLLFALILRQRSRHDASRREIGWGVILTAALIGLLLLAGISNPTKTHGLNHTPAVVAVTAGILLAGVCIVLGKTRSGGTSAALLGVAVGTSYAATAALLKAVTNIALRGPVPVLTSWQLYAVVGSGLIGLLLNQIAFRAGPLTASLPAIAIVDPLLSIAIGVLVYHEHLRHGPFRGLGLVGLVLLMGIAAIQVSRAGQDSDAAAQKRRRLVPVGSRSARPHARVGAAGRVATTVATVTGVGTAGLVQSPAIAVPLTIPTPVAVIGPRPPVTIPLPTGSLAAHFARRVRP
jgi:hypothetical protein